MQKYLLHTYRAIYLYKEFVNDVKWSYLIPESIIITLIPRQNVEILNYLCFMCVIYTNVTLNQVEMKYIRTKTDTLQFQPKLASSKHTSTKIKSKIIFIKRNHFVLCVVQSFSSSMVTCRSFNLFYLAWRSLNLTKLFIKCIHNTYGM